MIQSVKYIADKAEPLVNTGYLVNGEFTVPFSAENGHYQMVQKWISAGNTPEPAFTPNEVDYLTAFEVRREQEEFMKAGQLVGVDNTSRNNVGAEPGFTDEAAYDQWMLDLYNAYDNNELTIPEPPQEIIDRLEMFGVKYNNEG